MYESSTIYIFQHNQWYSNSSSHKSRNGWNFKKSFDFLLKKLYNRYSGKNRLATLLPVSFSSCFLRDVRVRLIDFLLLLRCGLLVASLLFFDCIILVYLMDYLLIGIIYIDQLIWNHGVLNLVLTNFILTKRE